MSRSAHDAHFARLWSAQCARNDRFSAGPMGAVVDTHQRILAVGPPPGNPIPRCGGEGAPIALEGDLQAAILELLDHHPRVAWAQRMNVGGMWRENADGTKRFIKFAFTGCSDIIGQLVCGRFLAIEVKRLGKNPTDEQLAFLARVNGNHGLAFVARSIDDVLSYLRRVA